MKKLKIVIVGGGTSGWFCASWLKKHINNTDVTLIESPNIPKMGVGESTAPHVNMFLDALGIDRNDFMRSTAATFKYANKFSNWITGNGEYEFNASSYPTNINLLYSEIPYPTSWDHWSLQDSEISTFDTFLKLVTDNKIDKFDKNFHSHYHYMMDNTSPFSDDGRYILNPLYSSSYHINADLTADYVRDKVGLPSGVNHVFATVKQVVKENDNITKLVLEDNTEVEADFFIDASGFKKVLVNDWPIKEYKHHPVDSAWVCQLDYVSPEEELVNYTQSIAQDYGWMFKIGLFHRMGSGYCYNSSMLSDSQAREDFIKMTNRHRFEPRNIKWKPHRLEYFGKGNTVALGLSAGFIEPMESNALYIVVNSIFKITAMLMDYKKTNEFNFDTFNTEMTHAVDDLSDYILIHYTLSSRTTNDMWETMREIGRKENHVDLIHEKVTGKNNTIAAAINGKTPFPNFVWAQWAHHAGIDVSKWIRKDFDPMHLELTRLHFETLEKKNRLISKTRSNNYHWHRDTIFNGVSYSDWEKKNI